MPAADRQLLTAQRLYSSERVKVGGLRQRVAALERSIRIALEHVGPLGDCCGLGPCQRKRGDKDDNCKLHDARRALVHALYLK